MNPRDIDARAGIGRAYPEVGRFREAADELEAVSRMLRSAKSHAQPFISMRSCRQTR
jgi:hypothetical protein